jgi:hypothetical protein
MEPAEGLPITSLQHLRTEIVLKDTRDVVFWFSISFRIATFGQGIAGKRAFQLTHQTRVRPAVFFPARPECGEKINSGEDEARNKD